MQKGQPRARSSIDENGTSSYNRQNTTSSYAQGFAEGFEAGRRAALDDVKQQKTVGTNGQRFSADLGHQRPQSPGNRAFIGAQQARPKTYGNPTNKDTQQQQLERRPGQEQKQNDHVHVTAGNVGRFTDSHQARRSFDEPIGKPGNGGRFTDSHQAQRSFDEPTGNQSDPKGPIRHERFFNQEHEMTEKDTKPNTQVRSDTRGHY